MRINDTDADRNIQISVQDTVWDVRGKENRKIKAKLYRNLTK